jgi:hypothetical protein
MVNIQVACTKFTSNITFQQEAVPAILFAPLPPSDLNEISIAQFFRQFFLLCLSLERHKLPSFRDIWDSHCGDYEQ